MNGTVAQGLETGSHKTGSHAHHMHRVRILAFLFLTFFACIFRGMCGGLFGVIFGMAHGMRGSRSTPYLVCGAGQQWDH
jgi:hypothetical protein